MRTTLDIDDDVLLAAKELARRAKKSAGEMISDLARRGLRAGPDSAASSGVAPDVAARKPEELFGFRPFPTRGGVVTNEIIDRLRDEEAD